ncbi:MAG: ABC transporter permease [Clostridiales bacterium]|jgi:oligopeptide transport system permease protein|nr:ABC transporter permease [Clostridiales bacterium]
MPRYILKRVLLGLVALFVVSTLTFFLMFLVPGGPFLSEKTPSASTLAALEKKYGLDKPVIVQYGNYMTNVLKGDLGPSMKQRGRTVNDRIGTRFPISARLGGSAMVLALFAGIPLGCLAALKRGRAGDNTILVISTVGIAMPSFITSALLMYIFSLKLGWLPSIGLDGPKNYIMPVAALAFYPTAYITRLMRSSMLDVLGQDYMRTAQAKGLPWAVRIFKHALRNAVGPIITYLGPALAFILIGSFVVEGIFTIPGLGNSFVSSITNRDYTVIMGTTLFLAALLIGFNILSDVLNKLLDQRIQLK